MGEMYVCVHACSQRGLMPTEYMFFGLFSSGAWYDIGSHIRHRGWQLCGQRGFTLHADGWIGDDRDRLDTPSHVRWNGDQLCNYSHYGYEFGLKDLLLPTDNIQHFIVVPKAEWDRNPAMKCDYDKGAYMGRAPASGAEPQGDFETIVRKRRDEGLARAFAS